jgi:hypothetical protein
MTVKLTIDVSTAITINTIDRGSLGCSTVGVIVAQIIIPPVVARSESLLPVDVSALIIAGQLNAGQVIHPVLL